MKRELTAKIESVTNPGVIITYRRVSYSLRGRIAKRILDEVVPKSRLPKLRHDATCSSSEVPGKSPNDKPYTVYTCASWCPYNNGEADLSAQVDLMAERQIHIEELLVEVTGLDIPGVTDTEIVNWSVRLMDLAPEDLTNEIGNLLDAELAPPNLKNSQSRGITTPESGPRDTNATPATATVSGSGVTVEDTTQKA